MIKSPGHLEEEREYTGSSQRTKNRKQVDPSSTVMADQIEASSAAQPSDISKSFARHENPGPSNQTKPYKCLICSKLCTRKNHLTNHIKSHKKETKKTQIIDVGVPPEEIVGESYRCLICFRSFSRLNDLTNHMKTHDKKPIASNKSPKSLSDQCKIGSTLTKKRLAECAFCGQSFGAAMTRDTHLLTHLGEKPYKCPSCPKYFRTSSHLKVHVRIHTGERPYKCIHCLRAFTQSHALKSHLRIHTGEKPYECKYCLKLFRCGSNLRGHLKTHPEEELKVVSARQKY